MTGRPGARGLRHSVVAAARLQRGARAVLGDDDDQAPASAAEAATAMRAVAAAGLERLRDTGDGSPASEELVAVVAAAHDLERHLRDLERHGRARRRADVDAGIRRLASVEGSAALLDQVCEEAARSCSLSRVLLSRVRDGVWSPWKLHDNTTPADTALPEADRATAVALDRLEPERLVVASGLPAIVTDHARTSRTVSRLMLTRPYILVPVTAGGRVLGLFHAAGPADGGPVGEHDRDALWAFAQGFAYAYERAVALERLQAQHDVVQSAFAGSEQVLADVDQEVDLVRLVGRATPPTRRYERLRIREPNAALHPDLTDRERDVLALMVQGLGNAAIAERLVVSRSTVKSHVRNILRKLEAVNRAEAITRARGC